MEKTNLRRRKYYHKHKSILQQEKQYKDLGTGSLGGTPIEDFKEEYEKIIKEKRRLRLPIELPKNVTPKDKREMELL